MAIHPHARKRLLWWIGVFFLLLVLVEVAVWWRHGHPVATKTQPNSQSSSTVEANTFDKTAHSTNSSSSLWVVVNKGRILPSDYEPAHLVVPSVVLSEDPPSKNMYLRSDAAMALEQLNKAASSEGVGLMLVSGYRSYDTQTIVYNSYVGSNGQAYADSTSARPGHSEHQTGLAADLGSTSRKCQLDKCFADLTEGKWLAANAYKYGFIIRYPKDKTDLTGYDYEPWHIRYVGTDLAAEINKTGQTLEQFFGLPAYTDYPAQKYQLR